MREILADIDSARATGQVIGLFFWGSIILWGLIKCFAMLRRPTVCKPCVVALSLVLIGWMFSSASFAVGNWFPEVARVISIVGAAAVLFFLLAAIILGIVGLALYDIKIHTQGRAQAVWAIVLSCLFVAVVISSLFIGSAADKLAAKTGSGSPIQSEKFNCQIEVPPRWIESKPSLINDVACLAMRRSGPEGYGMVIGEHIDGELELEAYMEAVKANLASNATRIDDDHTEPVTVDGLPFLRRTCVVETAAAKGMPMYFEQWVAVRPGFSWQIHLWGQVRGKEALVPQFRRIAESFRLLKKDQVVPGSAVISNVERAGWGYKTNLVTSEWKLWKQESLEQPLADFAAIRPQEAFIIMPVNLGSQPPELEAAAAGLLARLDIPFPSDDWTGKPWKNEWGEGLEVTGSRAAEKSVYEYRLRIAQRGPVAMLIGGWHHQTKGNAALVQRALDGITLLPATSPAEIPGVEEPQRGPYGLVCNDIGLWYYRQQQMDRAAPWFWLGFNQLQQDPAMLGNALDAWQQSGKSKEAHEKAGPFVAKFPKHASVHLHHARVLSDLKLDAEVEKAFQSAMTAGIEDENDVLGWLQFLNSAEKYALAEKSAEAWMKKKGGVSARIWHAQTVSYNNDSKRAVELMDALAKEHPDDRRVNYDLGELLNDAGEYARAAEVAEKILAESKESARALMILGWSQMGRKWYREAKESFEKVAKKQPDSEIVQNALRRASAMLGQGNDSDIKIPIAAVAIPEVVQKAIAAHQAKTGEAKDRPVVWLLSAKGYHFEKGKPQRSTLHMRAKVQTTEGASQMSTIEQSFDPLSERLFINRVEVRDENGKVITSSAGDAYVMDLDNGMATHDKKLHFQIPGLRAGCTLEYELSQETRATADTFTFQRHPLSDSAADIVFVTGDVSEVATTTNSQATQLQIIKQDKLLAWMGLDLPPIVREPYAVLFEERVPTVVLAGKEGTWKEVAEKSLSKDLAGRLEPEPEVVELAKELTKDAKDEKSKIAALARHVQKAVSYTAIEFGTRARRPNPAAQTLKQKYGDCKDQALLLHQLLSAVGVQSKLALVNTGWRIQPDLPTLDQFNHMIVHVPALGPDRLIDPTNKSLDLTAWQADNLWHSHALILEAGKSRLIPPAVPAADSARLVSKRSIRPEGDGWHVEETFTAHGYNASWLRSAFVGKDADKQLQNVQGILTSHAPSVRVHEFRFPALDDPTVPAAIEIAYDVPGRLQNENSMKRALLPALWEEDYLATTFVKDRRTPFRFTYPMKFESETTITGTGEITPDSWKAMLQAKEGRFAKWKFTAAKDSTLRFEFTAHVGDFAPGDYAVWHEEWNAATRAWQRPLIWKP